MSSPLPLKMTPEDEVFTFRQGSGETFKDVDDVKPHVRWETPRGRYDVVQQQLSLSKKQGYQSRRN